MNNLANFGVNFVFDSYPEMDDKACDAVHHGTYRRGDSEQCVTCTWCAQTNLLSGYNVADDLDILSQ